MTKIFTTHQGGFTEVRKKVISTLAIIFSLLFVIVIIVPALLREEPIRWWLVLVTFVVFAGVLLLGSIRALRRQRLAFESYKLFIDERSIRREQHNVPTIVMDIVDVKKIVESANGSFGIFADSALNAIGVPAQIHDRDALRILLTSIKPIEVKTTRSLSERLFIPFSLFAGILIAITSVTTNPVVDLIGSILIALIMAGGFMVIQLSRNVDKRTKSISWFFLIPLFAYLFIILGMIGSLTLQ